MSARICCHGASTSGPRRRGIARASAVAALVVACAFDALLGGCHSGPTHDEPVVGTSDALAPALDAIAAEVFDRVGGQDADGTSGSTPATDDRRRVIASSLEWILEQVDTGAAPSKKTPPPDDLDS